VATIARMAINLGWNGSQAESGLARTNKKTKEAGDSASKSASAFAKLGSALKGANDIKSTFEMARGVTQFATAAPRSFLALGGELETMQIKMGLLVGGFEKGAVALERMRQLSKDTGVPLAEVVDSFQKLKAAGVSSGDAEKLVGTFSKVSGLLGEGGVSQVADSIAQMARSGFADTGALQQLQNAGLPAFEMLAKRLESVNGGLVTMDEAMKAVEEKTVLASTAILAMQDAVKSPEALKAAEQLANSFDGQLSRLKTGAIELMRDIGKGLIDGLDLKGFLATLRGIIEGIALVVKQIVESFAMIGGPGGDGDRLEKNFLNARTLAIDIAETIVNGALDMVKAMQDGIAPIVKALAPGKYSVAWAKSKMDLGIISKDEYRDIMDRAVAAEGFGKFDPTKGLREESKTFFESVRNKALAMDRVAAQQGGRFNFQMPSLDFLRNVTIPQKVVAATSDPIVQRVEAGSAAAVEAIQRNNSRNSSQDKQQQQVDALKELVRQGVNVIAALNGIKMPAVAVIPK
jgi:hypothetical protein